MELFFVILYIILENSLTYFQYKEQDKNARLVFIFIVLNLVGLSYFDWKYLIVCVLFNNLFIIIMGILFMDYFPEMLYDSKKLNKKSLIPIRIFLACVLIRFYLFTNNII